MLTILRRTDGQFIGIGTQKDLEDHLLFLIRQEDSDFEYKPRENSITDNITGQKTWVFHVVSAAFSTLPPGVGLVIDGKTWRREEAPVPNATQPETLEYKVYDERNKVLSTFSLPKGTSFAAILGRAREEAAKKLSDWCAFRVEGKHLFHCAIVKPEPWHWVDFEHVSEAGKVTGFCGQRGDSLDKLKEHAKHLIAPGRNRIRTKRLGLIEGAAVDGLGHTWVEPAPAPVEYTFGFGGAPSLHGSEMSVKFFAPPSATDDELWAVGSKVYGDECRRQLCSIGIFPSPGYPYYVKRPNGTTFTRKA